MCLKLVSKRLRNFHACVTSCDRVRNGCVQTSSSSRHGNLHLDCSANLDVSLFNGDDACGAGSGCSSVSRTGEGVCLDSSCFVVDGQRLDIVTRQNEVVAIDGCLQANLIRLSVNESLNSSSGSRCTNGDLRAVQEIDITLNDLRAANGEALLERG